MKTAMKFYVSSVQHSAWKQHEGFCPFAVNTDARLKELRIIMGATPSSLDVSGRRDVCQAAACSAAAGQTGAASVSVLHTLTRKKPENAFFPPSPLS